MDILLINPGEIRHNYITEHLGIASLKAYVCAQGFSADTLDMAIEECSVQDALKKCLSAHPAIIGISLLHDSKDRGFALIRTLRKGGYTGKIVVGGYFATFASNEILSDFIEIDYVIRGEGEQTLHELMQIVLGKSVTSLCEIPGLSFRQGDRIIENPARPLIADLDILPAVDRKYARQILQKGSQLRVYATRGCWGKCTFCDIIGMYATSRGKAWRRRSVSHLVDEIEHLKATYKSDYFIFNDDQFLVKGSKNLQMVEEFAQELERRRLNIQFELMCRADTVTYAVMSRLKSVGLRRVFLGLESFDKKQLERYRKGISVRQNLKAVILLYKLKINVVASVILADAYTTLPDLLQQFFMLFQLKRRYFSSTHCQISVNKKLEIYRGSAVYRLYKEKGLLTKDHYLDGYDFRLRFWTAVRLGMFTLEERLSRIVLKPGDVFSTVFKKVKWYYRQTKALIFEAIPESK